MTNQKICIAFAGVVGSSKTPISNYLSTRLNLPIFNNDAIRTEVIEDLREFNSDEHLKRRNSRLKEIFENRTSFILDLSIDREWIEFKKHMSANDYKFFVISLDLSKNFLIQLYNVKKYYETLERIDKLINDHNIFLAKNDNDINLHISDSDFRNRCEICYKEVSTWIDKII